MTLVRNFLSLAGAETVSKLLTFGAFAYLARMVGPEGLGYVEFAGALLLCAGLIVDQGFGPYGAREIARAPQHTSALVAEIVAVRFMLAVGAYITAVGLVLWLDRPPMVTRLLLIYCMGLFAMPFLLQWVFQGHDRMPYVAWLQILRQTVFAGMIFVFVHKAAHLWIVAVAELAGLCSAAAYGVWVYRRYFGGSIRTPRSISKRLFVEGVPIGLSQLFWMVKMFGATLIVGMVASAEDVGFFGAAMRILIALHTFVWLYYFNLLPSLARTWQRGDGTFARLIARSTHNVMWISVAGGLVWIMAAPTIVTRVYGPAFSPAGPTLQWLAVVCVLAALSGHYRFGLIAAGRQNTEMVVAGFGALVALVLIPLGYSTAGPSGAARGLVIAEAVVWGSAWWCGRYQLEIEGHLRALSRPLCATSLTAGLLWVLPYSWAVQTLIGMVILIGLAVACDAAIRASCRRVAGQLCSWFWPPRKVALVVQPAREDIARPRC